MRKKITQSKGGVSTALINRISTNLQSSIDQTNRTHLQPYVTTPTIHKPKVINSFYAPQRSTYNKQSFTKVSTRPGFTPKRNSIYTNYTVEPLFDVEIYKVPPPNNPNQIIITLNCDEIEQEECCKYNEAFCANVDFKIFQKILNIVKNAVSLLLHEYMDFFTIPKIIYFDPLTIKTAVIVNYIINHILSRLKIDNPNVERVLNTMTNTFIMLPKNNFTLVNYFVKVTVKEINNSLQFKTMNKLITAHLIQELERLK